jgi:hypothetical protein
MKFQERYLQESNFKIIDTGGLDPELYVQNTSKSEIKAMAKPDFVERNTRRQMLTNALQGGVYGFIGGSGLGLLNLALSHHPDTGADFQLPRAAGLGLGALAGALYGRSYKSDNELLHNLAKKQLKGQ